MKFALFDVQCVVCSVQCLNADCSVQCTFCIACFAVKEVQRTVSTVKEVQCTVSFVQ